MDFLTASAGAKFRDELVSIVDAFFHAPLIVERIAVSSVERIYFDTRDQQ